MERDGRTVPCTAGPAPQQQQQDAAPAPVAYGYSEALQQPVGSPLPPIEAGSMAQAPLPYPPYPYAMQVRAEQGLAVGAAHAEQPRPLPPPPALPRSPARPRRCTWRRATTRRRPRRTGPRRPPRRACPGGSGSAWAWWWAALPARWVLVLCAQHGLHACPAQPSTRAACMRAAPPQVQEFMKNPKSPQQMMTEMVRAAACSMRQAGSAAGACTGGTREHGASAAHCLPALLARAQAMKQMMGAMGAPG